MSGDSKSATLCNEVAADLEDALLKMKLLKLEMERSSSSSTNNDGLKLEIRKSELDAESQHRYAQMKQTGALSQLQDDISKFEAAHAQLKVARREVDTETYINNMRIKEYKASMEAAKKGYERATNDMNDAKKLYEDAKAELEASTTTSIIASCLKKENNRLKIQVCQLEISESKMKEEMNELRRKNHCLEIEICRLKETMNAGDLKDCQVELEKVKDDNKSLKAEISNLTNDKLKLEGALKECRDERQRLNKENSELKKDKERLEDKLEQRYISLIAEIDKGCERATNAMNDAMKLYEDANEASTTTSIIVSRLEKENNRLQIQVCQMESAESKMKGEMNELIKKCHRLETEISYLKESQVRLMKIKDDYQRLRSVISRPARTLV